MQKTITLKSVAMCPKCYNHYDVDLKAVFKDIPEDFVIEPGFNTHFYSLCPKCHCCTMYFVVDKEISDSIYYFNKLGYHTKACCQGHCKINIRNKKYQVEEPYVYLYGRKKLTRKLYDKLCSFGWDDFSIRVFDQKKHKHIKHINNFEELSKSTTNVIYYSYKLTKKYLEECKAKYPDNPDKVIREMNNYFKQQCQQLAKILGGECLNEQKTSKSRNGIKT